MINIHRETQVDFTRINFLKKILNSFFLFLPTIKQFCKQRKLILGKIQKLLKGTAIKM